MSDIFSNYFIYGSIAYWLLLLANHLVISFICITEEYRVIEPDFYEQVKDLLNPATQELTCSLSAPAPCLNDMTLRELRTHIKVNHLHQQIKNRLGKSVSNARKQELLIALS